MTLGIAIPTPQLIHPDFSIGNLSEIIAYTKKHVCDNILLRYQGGVRTDKNRNICVKSLLDEGVDYILHLDADMIYPADIYERYLLDLKNMNIEPTVVGAYYFKRTEPYTPIAYIRKENHTEELRPFISIPPSKVKTGEIYTVDGLGFGGMMVSSKVYEKLGDDKWARYGLNFHIPQELPDSITHDLQFCNSCRDRDIPIYLHGSVRPKHIGQTLVDEQTYYDYSGDVSATHNPSVLVIMPFIDKKQAERAIACVAEKSGYEPANYMAVEDVDRKGFIHIINKAQKDNPKYELYVYLASDVIPGDNWLHEAVKVYIKTGSGVISLNSGRWDGKLPQFGMVSKKFIEKHGDGNIFHPKYKSHYADTEIGQVAKQFGEYAHAKKSLMMESDLKKILGLKQVNIDDKKLYAKRIKTLVNDDLAREFS